MSRTTQQQVGSPQVLGYAASASAWIPPPGVGEHSGQPIPPDADFFIPPPDEIGSVRSARTTLQLSKHPWSMAARLGLGLGITATIVLGGLVLLIADWRPGSSFARGDRVFQIALPTVIAAIVIGLTLRFTRFRQVCTYVGTRGAARYALAGGRNRPPRAEVFLFSDAAELRNRQTRHSVNGVYSHTRYDLRWTDPDRKLRFHLTGQHRGGKGVPKPPDPYHFALATELSWSQYLLGHLASQLEQAGFVHFNIKPGQWVRVGPGFFEFCLNQEVQRITTPEIKSINLAGGHFHITHKDARWFSRRGKFSFDYPNMANARLFLLAVEKLIGYRFG